MSTAGPNSPSSVTQYSQSGGTGAWSDEGNVTASDDAVASSFNLQFQPDASDTIRASGFNNSVPGGATVTGIVVEVEASRTGDDVTTFLTAGVGLVAIGDESDATTVDSQEVSTSEAYISFGSSTWNTDNGSPFTLADINSADFFVDVFAQRTGSPDGFGLQVLIDHIRVTIYYTAGSTPTTSTITAATMNCAGQSIRNSAARIVPVTAGTMNYAGQTAATIRATTSAAVAATMQYAGQAITTISGVVSIVTAGTLAYGGQAIATIQATVVAVAAATMSYAGQTVDTIRNTASAVIAAVMNYAAQSVASTVGADTLTGRVKSRLTDFRLFLGL